MGPSDRGKRTNSFSMELSGCAVDFQHLIIGNAFPCSDRAKSDQNKQLYHAPRSSAAPACLLYTCTRAAAACSGAAIRMEKRVQVPLRCVKY